MPGSVVEAIVDVAESVVEVAAPVLPIVGYYFGGPLGAIATSLVVGSIFEPEVNKPARTGTAGPSGGASTASQSKQMVSVRQAAAPRRVVYGETRVGGIITFIESTSNDSELHLVITLAGHEVNQIGDVYFNDEVVPLDGSGNATGTYAGYATITKSTGNEAAGVQPFPALVAASAGNWTAAHCQTGCAKIYVKLTFNADLFPGGIPNVTAVVQGKKVYDPRSATTAYSANAALCIADYLCDTAFGVGAVYADEIDETQLISAANECDEDVTLASGSTENRYELHGSFDTGGSPREILGRMLTSMGGKVAYIGGKWFVFPAVYVTPTITLTEDDLRGPVHIKPRLSRRDLFNRVKGVYISPENNWQPADFPPVTNSTYLSEDQSEQLWLDVDLPFTKSAAAAQRLSRIELERNRQQITLSLKLKLSGWRVQPGDTVMVTLDRYGYDAKVFEVLETALIVENNALGVDAVLRETASSVFDWSSSNETQVDPAPDSNLPNPFVVTAVLGVPSVSEELYETRDGRGVAAKAIVTWAAPSDAYVREYQVEYKLSSASDYTVLPRQSGTTREILDIAPGRYDFRVKFINQLGVSSAYATLSNKDIVGLGAAPSAATILGLQVAGNLAILLVQQSTDLDVRRGGRVIVRHTEATSDQSWQESFSIGNANGYAGDSTIIVLPLKAGSYGVRFEDSSGQQSGTVAWISTKQASVLQYTTTDTVQEDTTFPGSHSGTVAVDSILKINGSGLFDDIADFDSISSLDDYGGVATAGVYSFSVGFDFGSVVRRRLTAVLEGTTVNVNDLIDDRSGNVDDWLDFDGTAGGGSCDAWVEFRETDGDPTASPSPAFSDWKRLDSAEVECRGAEFRLRMTSDDVAYNLHISTLRVRADQVV